MPLLASLMLGLFTGLAEFFTKWVTKKTAMGLAAVGVFATLTVSLYGAVGAFLIGVTVTFPAGPGLATGIWLVVPDNAPICISAMLSCDAAVALYRWNVENLKFASYVT